MYKVPFDLYKYDDNTFSMFISEEKCPWNTEELLTWIGIFAIATGAQWESEDPIEYADIQAIRDWLEKRNIPYRATGRICKWKPINEHRGILIIDEVAAYQGKLDNQSIFKFIYTMYSPLFLDYSFGAFIQIDGEFKPVVIS